MGALLLWHSPVHDVGQQVVVPQPVLRVHLFVVHRQGAVQDTPLLRRQETPSYMPFIRGELAEKKDGYLRIPRQGELGIRERTHRESSPPPSGPL